MTPIPLITSIIAAGDRQSAEVASAMLADGAITFDEALPLVGTYARIGWLLDCVDAGYIARALALSALPDLWPGSDPDDTDPRFLAAWSEAWVANRKRTIRDGPPLPPGRFLTIYRGQDRSDRPGIAWSLDRATAEKFANGAALRVPGAIQDPEVREARVHRRMVMAYLTARGEAEVIVNPYLLSERRGDRLVAGRRTG